jgi:TonB family protein
VRVVVLFVINDDGRVTDVAVETPSGYTPLDQSAFRAVLALGQLPPLPRAYEKDRLTARFVFELLPPDP